MYKPSAKTPEENLKKLEAGRSQAQIWADRLDNVTEILHAFYRHDNHVPGYVDHYWHRRVIKPLRAQADGPCAQAPELRRGGNPCPRGSFAFFPLHTEPEVTLLVYSKPWLNQIEAARLTASSLPLGMKLVVKEHPWSVGKRPLSYYRKLLQIPNLVLAPPEAPARDFVQKAALTVVISGSVGLEALMLAKAGHHPGPGPFQLLAGQPCCAMWTNRMNWALRCGRLLTGHQHDEKALKAYMAAVMRNSCPVDFYTRLLKAPGRLFRPPGGRSGRRAPKAAGAFGRLPGQAGPNLRRGPSTGPGRLGARRLPAQGVASFRQGQIFPCNDRICHAPRLGVASPYPE